MRPTPWVAVRDPDSDRKARVVGERRQAEAERMGLPNKHGLVNGGLAEHLLGARGECYVAKSLGIPWEGSVNTFKLGGDVGQLQVRTRGRHHYELIVRQDDRDEDIYVLVTDDRDDPDTLIRGWIVGKDAKRPEWLKDYGDREPAYFVPQSELRDMNELIC